MSKIGVSLKIDVSKIDKALLFKGAKGTYLDATVFINVDEADQYDNNGMITQTMPKDSQDKGAILGNCKVFWRDDGKPVSKASAKGQQGFVEQPSRPAEFDNFDDDIPF